MKAQQSPVLSYASCYKSRLFYALNSQSMFSAISIHQLSLDNILSL